MTSGGDPDATLQLLKGSSLCLSAISCVSTSTVSMLGATSRPINCMCLGGGSLNCNFIIIIVPVVAIVVNAGLVIGQVMMILADAGLAV